MPNPFANLTLADVMPYILWGLGWLLFFFYLRGQLTPKRLLSIWETEGVLSGRQIMAWIIGLYGLYGRCTGRLSAADMEACFQAAYILFGIGGVVNAVSKYKPAPAQVNAGEMKVGEHASNVVVGVETTGTQLGPQPAPPAAPGKPAAEKDPREMSYGEILAS